VGHENPNPARLHPAPDRHLLSHRENYDASPDLDLDLVLTKEAVRKPSAGMRKSRIRSFGCRLV
jgi:hypothetical protein